ncbi:MAG TPA: GNAT family N-acetyltransferase [Armatimonadota bacterium]|nr:GNAT family N-acetyltransferase [Armatimonadota bacterium]
MRSGQALAPVPARPDAKDATGRGAKNGERMPDNVNGGTRVDLVYEINAPVHPEDVNALNAAVGFRKRAPERVAGALAGCTAYVTVRDGGRLVGIGRLLSDGYLFGYINNMAVHPDYQGRGIGRRILEMLMEQARDLEQVFLYTDTADEFYLRYGFERSEKRLYVYRRH